MRFIEATERAMNMVKYIFGNVQCGLLYWELFQNKDSQLLVFLKYLLIAVN